jgi:hypothetical protein
LEGVYPLVIFDIHKTQNLEIPPTKNNYLASFKTAYTVKLVVNQPQLWTKDTTGGGRGD